MPKRGLDQALKVWKNYHAHQKRLRKREQHCFIYTCYRWGKISNNDLYSYERFPFQILKNTNSSLNIFSNLVFFVSTLFYPKISFHAFYYLCLPVFRELISFRKLLLLFLCNFFHYPIYYFASIDICLIFRFFFKIFKFFASHLHTRNCLGIVLLN